MALLQKFLHMVVPQAINDANSCYQEFLRGTSNQDLYTPIAARIVAYVPMALAPYAHAKFSINERFIPITGIAITILVQQGLNYYGLKRGYNVDLNRELIVVAFSLIIHPGVENLTTPKTKGGKSLDYTSKTDNQKRVALLLHILFGMCTSYFLYKFQADRNPSLPLKSYLYFAAGTTILRRLQWYNELDRKVGDATSLRTSIPYYDEVYQTLAKVLIELGMAQAVKLATGHQIQMAWHWEIVSSAASSVSRTYFPRTDQVIID